MSSKRTVAVDTNLLVLLIVGLTDINLIEKHKRTKDFEKDDFTLLMQFLEGYEEILLTPHVLTEVSNLVSQIGEPLKSKIRTKLSELIQTHPESYEKSALLRKHHLFPRLGLTDCGLLSLAEADMPLITVDLDLYLAACACKRSSKTVNFNHIRQARLLTT